MNNESRRIQATPTVEPTGSGVESCFYRLLLEELADFPERSERSGLEFSDLLDAEFFTTLSGLLSDFSELPEALSFFESEPDFESALDFESESFFELESPLEEDPAEPDFLA